MNQSKITATTITKYIEYLKDAFMIEEANRYDIKGKELCTNGLDINIESGKVDIAGKFSGKNSVDSEFGKVIIENDLKKEECGYDVDVEFGKFVVDGKKFVNDHESYNESSDNNFKIKCSSGDVELDFNK